MIGGLQMGSSKPTSNTFLDEPGRQAHLFGRIATWLKAESSELFAQSPSIEKVDIVVARPEK